MFVYVKENLAEIENGYLMKYDLIKIFFSMQIPFRPRMWKIIKFKFTVTSIERYAYNSYSINHRIQTNSKLLMVKKLDAGEICCSPFRNVLFKLIIFVFIIFISLVFISISLSQAPRKPLREVLLFVQVLLLFLFCPGSKANPDLWTIWIFPPRFVTDISYFRNFPLPLSGKTLFVSKYSTVSNPECLQCFLQLCLSSFSNSFDSRNRFLLLPPTATAGT